MVYDDDEVNKNCVCKEARELWIRVHISRRA